jgi:hypothetical protein
VLCKQLWHRNYEQNLLLNSLRWNIGAGFEWQLVVKVLFMDLMTRIVEILYCNTGDSVYKYNKS